MAWISRTLFSTSVKSPNSFASASAASTAFWAACSKRTKNSLFLGRSDRRTGVLLWRHILRHRDRRREGPSHQSLADALGDTEEDFGVSVVPLERLAGGDAHQTVTGPAGQDMDVDVWHLLPGCLAVRRPHVDAVRGVGAPDRAARAHGGPREPRRCGLVEVIDRLEVCCRHHQDVSLGHLPQIGDRHNGVVTEDEIAGRLAGDDLAESAGAGAAHATPTVTARCGATPDRGSVGMTTAFGLIVRDGATSPRKRAPWHEVCSRARQTSRRRREKEETRCCSSRSGSWRALHSG